MHAIHYISSNRRFAALSFAKINFRNSFWLSFICRNSFIDGTNSVHFHSGTPFCNTLHFSHHIFHRYRLFRRPLCHRWFLSSPFRPLVVASFLTHFPFNGARARFAWAPVFDNHTALCSPYRYQMTLAMNVRYFKTLSHKSSPIWISRAIPFALQIPTIICIEWLYLECLANIHRSKYPPSIFRSI